MTCPNCGEANPERARFCLNCGAALQAPEGRRDVRKVVTVVYCDVTGSTALGERLDPEPLGQVMGRWYEAMRLVVERHRGRVQKFIGDAVLATFGVPVLREDDALRAVRAAAGMQDALAELNAALTRDWGVGLEVRVGVSTGEVVVGDPRPGGALVVGDAVNRAERLQAAARPGEVLLDRQTWQLARDAVVVAPVAPEELADPLARVDAYRLVDVSPDALGHARRHEGLLVGRADELQLFDWVYRRAVRESTCHLLTVLGAAGVGKSRLVAEAVEAVGEAATVLLGHCLPDAEGSTFWPVAQAVRAAAEVKRADSPEEARAKLDGLLGGAADGARVADRIGRLIGLEDAPLPAEETVWAVRRFLEVLASRRPLLLILDDLHWAQPTLLDLVEQLVDLTREAPILLVAVARPELLEQRPTWAGGKLNASTVMLEPLDERESATLLAQLAGEATLPEEAAAAITRTAEGNPLFLEELLATLIEEGRLEHRDGRWVGGDLATVAAPPSIHALLAARLDRLGAGERGLIERAAVIGHAFDPAALAALTPPADRAEVPAQLDSLVRRELLRPADPSVGGRGWYQFRHLLVRDAAYDSLPKQTRAELHERYAGWLAERVGARSREYEEILGYHLERAHRFLAELGPVDAHGVGLAAAAAERLAAAGRRAVGRGDLPASINLLDRAIALLPPEDPSRLHLLTELGEALVQGFDWDRASRLLDEALAAADRTGDAALRAHAALGKLDLRLDAEPDRPDSGPNTFRSEVQGVLALLEELGDEQGQARAWRLLALDSYLRCRIAPAEEEMRLAYEHAHRADDDLLEATSLYVLAQAAFWGPAPVAEGIRRCEDIRERAGDNYRVQLGALHALAGLHAMQGRFEVARQLGEQASALAEELGPNRFAAICSQFLGVTELLAGDPAAAEARLRWGYGILERTGERGLRSELAANLARALREQGRDDEALRLASLSGELAVRDDLYAQVERRGPMARVLAGRGDTAEAERLAREAVAMAQPTDMLNMRANALADLAAVLRLAGRAAEAEPLLGQALDLYQRKGNQVSAARVRDLLG